MNVANLIPNLGGGPGLATLGGDQGAANASGIFGAMLASELTNAMGGQEQSTIMQMLPADIDKQPEELTNLLAMLEQMLANMQQPPLPFQLPTDNQTQQQVAVVDAQVSQMMKDVSTADMNSSMASLPIMAAVAGQKQTAVDPFLQQLANVLQNPDEDKLVQAKQGLATTFMQQGMSQDEASQMVQLLSSLGQTGKETELPEVTQARQQVTQLLESMGIDLNKAEKTNTGKQTANIVFNAKNPLAGQRGFQVNHLNSQGLRQQPTAHQVNAALATYQLKPVAQMASLDTTVDKHLLNGQQPIAGEALTDTAEPVTVATIAPAVSTSQNQSAALGQSAAPAGSQYVVREQHVATDVSNMFVKQLKMTNVNGVSEARLILHPQSLGQVNVKIISSSQGITAHFAADTVNGKELLDNQLPQLRAALTQMGLQVDRLEVSQQQQTQQPQFGFQQQREQNRGQQENQQQRNRGDEEQAEFSLEALTDESSTNVASWLRASKANVEYSA